VKATRADEALFTGSQRLLQRVLRSRGWRHEVAEIHGAAVGYYDVAGTGSGPPVLLVHGLGGTAHGYVRLVPGLLRHFRRVLVPDLPGHGLSPPAPGGALPLQRQLEVLEAFARRTVEAPALVVGNSLGGAMSVLLAHRAPSLVRALALVAPAGARVAPGRMAEVFRALSVKDAAGARALIRRLFHRPPASFLALAHPLRHMFGTEAVMAAFRELDPDTAGLAPEELQRLSQPVLLLWGASDRLLPPEGVEYFRAHLPTHAEVHVVKGFGHVPQVERPAEVLQHLLDFSGRWGLLHAAR
jgi:pimeloyl-ACP methyl ester carboxylesterase